MTIHHSTIKKAEKLGIILTELPQSEGKLGYSTSSTFPDAGILPANAVQAYWPKFNVYAFGAGDKPANVAMEEAEALIKIKDQLPNCSILNDPNDPFMVRVFLTHERLQVLDRDGSTPRDALLMITGGKVWQSTTTPSNGGEAHKQGFPITDNPYDEETDEEDFSRWDEEWEESADEADAEEDKDVSGSVVKPEYRMRYAELGHPAHCGDELAVVLNNLVLGKTATDLEKFEAICAANGVDTTKYKREGTGWQGRIRMTGRNLLARKVYAAGGVLNIPPEARTDENVHSIQLTADWMAKQPFKLPKPKATAESEASNG